MDFANATESAIVQHIIGETDWTALAGGPFVQLHDGDPGEDGLNNTLPDMGGRKAASFNAESGGAADTSADIEWTNGGAGTVTVSHVTLWDTVGTGDPPTGGFPTYQGPLTAPVAVDPGRADSIQS